MSEIEIPKPCNSVSVGSKSLNRVFFVPVKTVYLAFLKRVLSLRRGVWQGVCSVTNVMPKLALPILVAFVAISGVPGVQAGEEVVPRKQFKQSTSYPFVFRPECYLATAGPGSMRFDAAPPHCPDRTGPPLTAIAKADFKADASPKAELVAALVSAEPQPPSNSIVITPRSEVDLTRMPDEVLDFFKSTDGRPIARNYLFDPIFQPAPPNDLPKSKATYKQK